MSLHKRIKDRAETREVILAKEVKPTHLERVTLLAAHGSAGVGAVSPDAQRTLKNRAKRQRKARR